MLLAALAIGLTLPATGWARPDLTLTVQVAPRTISPGQTALTVIDLANSSPGMLTSVVLTLRLPAGLSVLSAAGCTRERGSVGELRCAIGTVARGARIRRVVVAHAVGQASYARQAAVDYTLHVGAAAPIRGDVAATFLPLNDAAAQGSCRKAPSTLSATFDEQTAALPSPPPVAASLGLPCTPLAVSVAPTPPDRSFRTPVAIAEVPRLVRVATIVLYFPAGTLPDERLIANLPRGAVPSFANPDPLWKTDPATPSGWIVVPLCKPGPTLPIGWQSCIVRVDATYASDLYDAGTITLIDRGAGLGDPRYVG